VFYLETLSSTANREGDLARKEKQYCSKTNEKRELLHSVTPVLSKMNATDVRSCALV
jgi:hypothetical protein